MSHDLAQPAHQDSHPSKIPNNTNVGPSPQDTLHPSPTERPPSFLNNSFAHAQCTPPSDSPSFSSSSPAKSSVTLSPSFAGERRGPTSPGLKHLLAPDLEVHPRAPADAVGSRWTAINQPDNLNIPSNSQNPVTQGAWTAHDSNDAPVLKDATLPAPKPQVFHHHLLSQPDTTQLVHPQDSKNLVAGDPPLPSTGVPGVVKQTDAWLSTMLDHDRDRATSTPPVFSGASPSMQKDRSKRRTFPLMGAHPARKPDAHLGLADRRETDSTNLASHSSPSSCFPQQPPKFNLMSVPAEKRTAESERGLYPTSYRPQGIRELGECSLGSNDSKNNTSVSEHPSQNSPSASMSPPYVDRRGHSQLHYEADSYPTVTQTARLSPSDSRSQPALGTLDGSLSITHHSCASDGCNSNVALNFDPKDAKWDQKPITFEESLRLQEDLAMVSVGYRRQQEEAERRCARARRYDLPQPDIHQDVSINSPYNPSIEPDPISRGNKRKPEDTTPPLREEPLTKNPRLAPPITTPDVTTTLANETSGVKSANNETLEFSEPMRILFGKGPTLYQQPYNDWRNMWGFPALEQTRSRRNSHPPTSNGDKHH